MTRADLVVRPHDGGEGHVVGVAGDGLTQGFGVDAAVRVDREVLDGGALVFAEPVDRVEDGMVFHGTREDPGAGRVGVAAGPVQALHGEVVGLGAAGGGDHLAGAGAQGFRQGFAGFLDRPAGRRPAACREEALPVTANWAVIASTASGTWGWSRRRQR